MKIIKLKTCFEQDLEKLHQPHKKQMNKTLTNQ